MPFIHIAPWPGPNIAYPRQQHKSRPLRATAHSNGF